MTHQNDPFAGSVAQARKWLTIVTEALGSDDPDTAYRSLRAWFHTVRDRISIAGAAHLSAQLPELLCGMFFEDWVPSHVPVAHDRPSFIAQFAREAGVPHSEVPATAGHVTDALDTLFSPGELDRVFATLPTVLVETIWGRTHVDEFDDDEIACEEFEYAVDPDAATVADSHGLSALEDRMLVLGDAIAILTHRLDVLDATRISDADSSELTRRILVSEGLLSE
ncbi:DUF2267 domain-containing protein [Antrihabitans sp. YC2-6]|uniref:DUF2267 domain-containing protein n=1 Tax=Antrihabitans sp. YC2-6 TaxID=2799498 RepID=UPI0018F71F49|nr:DUF2267 domain-containing protein [Antrihabitans sp. YC2-6]MBJ8347000.1 DUF2267 domain-containing protein [Antrihabitans sp. YC2-6]